MLDIFFQSVFFVNPVAVYATSRCSNKIYNLAEERKRKGKRKSDLSLATMQRKTRRRRRRRNGRMPLTFQDPWWVVWRRGLIIIAEYSQEPLLLLSSGNKKRLPGHDREEWRGRSPKSIERKGEQDDENLNRATFPT